MDGRKRIIVIAFLCLAAGFGIGISIGISIGVNQTISIIAHLASKYVQIDSSGLQGLMQKYITLCGNHGSQSLSYCN